MADRILVLNTLGHRFGQFAQIADISARLRTTLHTIRLENERAAGQDDVIARQYRAQVVPAGELLDGVMLSTEGILTVTGYNGRAAVQDFDNGDQDASDQANAW